MNSTKTTSPGWPDPTEWVNQLYQRMAERQALYDTESDPLLKRNKVNGMLGLVISSLLELPAFKNDTVHLPLKDLMIFLSDLDRGRDHPWSAPVNFGGTNITTTAQGELKRWVRAANGVLQANGFKPVEAYRRIAKGLNESGRTIRKRPVRWQRVQAWCLEDEAPGEYKVRKNIERWWNDFQKQLATIPIDDGHGRPIGEKQTAGLFADLCWSLDNLRDQSVSMVSE